METKTETMITADEAKKLLDQPLHENETPEERIDSVSLLLRPFSELQKEILEQAAHGDDQVIDRRDVDWKAKENRWIEQLQSDMAREKEM